MRLLMLAAVATLGLAACRNNDQHDNTMNVDENLTAENIVSNDVTAIDAVTGDAANMAADVNYSAEIDNGLDNEANAAAPSNTSKPHPKSAPPVQRPRPATDTVTNSSD